MALQNFSVFKFIGTFATILMLILFFGSSAITALNAMKNGDWNEVLKNTGGKLLSLDNSLIEETTFLIDESSKATEERDLKAISIHFAYGFGSLFIYFLIFYWLFALLNWFAGWRGLSAIFDILAASFILISFFLLEFLYSSYFLGVNIIPLSGVYNFITALPTIIVNLF